MVLSLTTNTGNSYQASQANSLGELTLLRATTDSSPTSTNLSSGFEGRPSFGAEPRAIANAYRSRTKDSQELELDSQEPEFRRLSFSARKYVEYVVRATAA